MVCAVERMRQEDIPGLRVLWGETPGIGLSSADTPQALSEFLRRNPTTCFVARHGEQVIGSVLGGFDGRRGYVYHLAVGERFRHQGLGRALLVRVMEAFGELGARKVHLFVFRDNEQAIAFYQHAGWELRHDIVVMSCSTSD